MTPGNTCNHALWSLWWCHHAFWEIRHAGTCVSVWWIWAVPVIVARFLSVVSSFFYFIFGEWILVVKVLRWCVCPLHMHCHGKLQTKKKNANGEMIVCLRTSTLLSVLGFFCACFSVLLLPCATANPTQLAFRSHWQEMCHLTLVRHVLKRRKQMFSDFKRHFVFVPFESTNCTHKTQTHAHMFNFYLQSAKLWITSGGISQCFAYISSYIFVQM